MLPVEPVYPTSVPSELTNVPFIAAFPNEIIQHIFRFLPSPCKMALASRSFRHLANLWYEWEVQRIQHVPMVSINPNQESIIKVHQQAVKNLHLVAASLYCNSPYSNNHSPLERYEWECAVSHDLIAAILREYPLNYKTSCVKVITQLAIPLQMDLPLSFHCLNILLIKNEDIAKIVNKIIHSKHLNSLTKLHVITKGIIFIPEWIGHFTHLEKMDMGYNLISKIPPEVGLLKNLRKLNLQFNVRLSALPEQISQLTNLIKLNLGDNEFTEIPETVSKLPSLKKLLMHRNRISHLSKNIKLMTSLEYLNLNRNKIKIIPEEISHLSSLRELTINYNELEYIPHSLATLTQLVILSVAFNRLTRLPCSMEQMSEVTVLEISGNKISTIPEELKSKPNLTIRNNL